MEDEDEEVYLVLEESFIEWAFGEKIKDFDFFSRMELMEKWNSLHSDLFILKPEDIMAEDLKRMIAFWTIEGRPDGTVI